MRLFPLTYWMAATVMAVTEGSGRRLVADSTWPLIDAATRAAALLKLCSQKRKMCILQTEKETRIAVFHVVPGM
jgi:hypothetical protein